MHQSTPLPQLASSKHTYSVGSLTYTKRGLMVLSLWLLWGDFAFNFFESIFVKFIPIYLKDLHASNTLIGVMGGSFAGMVNVLFLPAISRWSDDLRTPMGRRIPLLYVITPLTVGAVVGIGFAPRIGDWLFNIASAYLPAAGTKAAIILTLLCMLTVSFHFFNMVLVNAYNWLIRDVVPLEVMSRFLAWFSIVGTISGTLFLWFVFPHLMTHREGIFFGVGVFYLVAFFLMCRNVREGDYIPPTPVEQRPGILSSYAVYFRECLQLPIYRNYFIVSLLIAVALNCAGNFLTLFASETLQLDMEHLGHIFAYTGMISILALYPIGWLCDRFTPMYVMLGAIMILCAGSIMAPILVHEEMGYLVYSLSFSLPVMAWNLSQRAASMKLFPAEKFGQFAGAVNVFSCGALIVGNILIGVVMDLTHSNYRMAFFWTALISCIAIFPMTLVIRAWKQHGGHDGYVPPLPD